MTTLDSDYFLMRSYTDPNSGCWHWGGFPSNHGYGMAWPNHLRGVAAHRASYECHKGPIPDGMVVKHSCDTPGCVNPDHLSVGTRDENMEEAPRIRKKAPKPYVRDCPVREREVLSSLREPIRSVARRLDVSPSTVRRIRQRLGVYHEQA